MSDLKKNILEKISDQEITPKSRWWYIIGHVSLWSVFVLAILVGSLAFGMLIFEIFSSEWQLAMMVRETGIRVSMFSILPFVWIVCVTLVVTVSGIFFRNTSRGYRHSNWKVVLGIIIISSILGGVGHASRLSEVTDELLQQKAPAYREKKEAFKNRVLDPEKGVLGGVIESIEQGIAVFRDHRGNEWEVRVDCDSPRCQRFLSDQPTDKPVLLIGEKSEEGVFELRDVRKPDREKLKKAIRRGMPLRDNLRRDDTRRPAKPEVIREVREVIKDDPELREKVIHRIQMDKNERGERIDVGEGGGEGDTSQVRDSDIRRR